MAEEQKPGPTGSYPSGKLGDNDEGGINIGIEAREGRVLVHFGKQISWLGLNPEDAIALAAVLSQKAWEAKHVKVVDLG